MKIENIFKRSYGFNSQKYPLIKSGGVYSFITDLPITLTQTQLDKLTQVSFAPDVLEFLVGPDHVQLVVDKEAEDFIKRASLYYTESLAGKTWKEYAQGITSLIRDELDGDFHEN